MDDNQYGSMRKGLLKEKLTLERNLKAKKRKKKDAKNTFKSSYFESADPNKKIAVEVRYIFITCLHMYAYILVYICACMSIHLYVYMYTMDVLLSS
jgi:hypothetical protein